MTIRDLVFSQSSWRNRWLMIIATTGGIANAAALAVATDALHTPGVSQWNSALLFAFLVFVAIGAARYTSFSSVRAIEQALYVLKARLVGKIEVTELSRLERIGVSEILDRTTENVTLISASAPQIGSILQSFGMTISALVYLAFISRTAFLVLIPLQFLAIVLQLSRSAFLDKLLEHRAHTRVRFLDRIRDLLDGAKEIRFHRERRRDVRTEFAKTSGLLRDTGTRTSRAFTDNQLFLNANLYLLFAALVFVLPKHMTINPTVMTKSIASILFVWGNVQGMLNGYSSYVEANSALANIQSLERKLDDTREVPNNSGKDSVFPEIPGRIEAKGVYYEYPSTAGDKAFAVGPIDLTIESGELLFVVGGNGAGKSTLLKVLTGLYLPTSGELNVGGKRIDPENVADYREKISAIFADFHLFSRAYGLLDVDPDAVQDMLRKMKIDRKTSFQGGRFTHRNLSTGQRKRLAMVLLLLEDRPIVVLDEWAADQDPDLRKYFYHELLPELKKRGKTVIVVSHDDRYFACADRVVSMEYGLLSTLDKNSSITIPSA